MNPLSSFLEKFKKLRDPKREREEIAKLISNCLKIEVPSTLIEIKGNCLQINMRGGVKTEIFMKKEKILECLEEDFPKLHIKRLA